MRSFGTAPRSLRHLGHESRGGFLPVARSFPRAAPFTHIRRQIEHMCGFAGFQGDFSTELLARMTAAVEHRGPDGEGRSVFGGDTAATRTGLGHRRLSIIDLSDAGSEPMKFACTACGSSDSHPLVLTYNGEIYNFRELRDELIGKGHSFESHTDSEILLHLYAEEGIAMLSRLNGIFAFAIYDGRENARHGARKGDLFVARDQVGVKPFYYSSLKRGFLFASEIKSILQCPEVSRDIDPSALHRTIAYLWTPAPQTVLRDVHKLEPGCAMIVRGGSIARHWRYYDLPYGREWLREDERQLQDRVHDAVQLAVTRQMVADVPVGAFLSGGLDSSAVVAMMRHADPGGSHQCYTIGFDEHQMKGAPPDLPFARKVAAHLGVPLREITVNASMIDGLERMLYFLDEPQADPAPLNAMLIARAAKQDGIKVLLSGTGGDDIFSGYRRHYAQRLEHLWSWMPAGARMVMAAGAGSVERSPAAGNPLLRRVAKSLAHANLPADERMTAYFWWGGENMRRALYSPDLTYSLAASQTADPLLESLARIPDEKDSLNRMLYLEGKHFLADHNLNYTDKMGMSEGVEVRVPLLDVDLIDLATRIPPHLKQKGSVGKYIFKKSMEAELPKSVIYRPKTGFGAPLRQWLHGELKERVDDILSPAAISSRGLFDARSVRRLVDLDRTGTLDASFTIFSLMCVELWARMFIDAPTPAMSGGMR